jgi:hypothetical protein
MRLCAKSGTKVHIIIIRDEYLREYYCFLGKKVYLCSQIREKNIKHEEISVDCHGCISHRIM